MTGKPSDPDQLDVLFSENVIQERVQSLAREIERDVEEGTPLHVIGILKGAFVFVSDLIRALNRSTAVHFIRASSYGDSTTSSGNVDITYDPEESIEGKNVLLVDDIVDTGRTLNRLYDQLRERSPASLRVCTLLRKPENIEVSVELDYVGFDVPERFVVGYGLDHAEQYRNLPFLAALSEEQ